MAAFPEFSSINYPSPVVEEIQYRTLRSQFDGAGREIRRRKWLYPKRRLRYKYENITVANARTIWQFYLDRHGSYTAFSFFFRVADTYVGEHVGEGDGSTTVFSAPFKGGSGLTVYNDGTETAITLGAQSGSDGEDQFTFASAPADGNVITANFTAQLKVRCRFMEDIFSRELFYGLLTTTGITLQGLLNA